MLLADEFKRRMAQIWWWREVRMNPLQCAVHSGEEIDCGAFWSLGAQAYAQGGGATN